MIDTVPDESERDTLLRLVDKIRRLVHLTGRGVYDELRWDDLIDSDEYKQAEALLPPYRDEADKQ